MGADLPVTATLRKKVLRVLFISLLLDLVSCDPDHVQAANADSYCAIDLLHLHPPTIS